MLNGPNTPYTCLVRHKCPTGKTEMSGTELNSSLSLEQDIQSDVITKIMTLWFWNMNVLTIVRSLSVFINDGMSWEMCRNIIYIYFQHIHSMETRGPMKPALNFHLNSPSVPSSRSAFFIFIYFLLV